MGQPCPRPSNRPCVLGTFNSKLTLFQVHCLVQVGFPFFVCFSGGWQTRVTMTQGTARAYLETFLSVSSESFRFPTNRFIFKNLYSPAHVLSQSRTDRMSYIAIDLQSTRYASSNIKETAMKLRIEPFWRVESKQVRTRLTLAWLIY